MRNITVLTIACSAALWAQNDPGERRGPGAAGQPLAGLSAADMAAFERGRDAFLKDADTAAGLGPRFNLDSCVGCHSQPAPGGSSPARNPQIPVASRMGAINRIPEFIRPDGPVRVVRFRRGPEGRPDGGVHSLFVISGRSDAPDGCRITQPDFSDADNLTFRIPTPVFGMGLIEAIPGSTLRASLAASAERRTQLGIEGRFNTSSSDGSISRFGWKAQHHSILLFSGEASNVEMGITNSLFPYERDEEAACASKAGPEDSADHERGTFANTEFFSQFMRFLAPPRPAPATPAIERGRTLFESTGCAACHTPTMRTGASTTPALNDRDVALYSDLALHRMGQRLADGITQGNARGDDWRTAPLWGLGQRIFFLHDGRTRDLVEAIQMHDSPGSEARTVIRNFNALGNEARQDLIEFLRSL